MRKPRLRTDAVGPIKLRSEPCVSRALPAGDFSPAKIERLAHIKTLALCCSQTICHAKGRQSTTNRTPCTRSSTAETHSGSPSQNPHGCPIKPCASSRCSWYKRPQRRPVKNAASSARTARCRTGIVVGQAVLGTQNALRAGRTRGTTAGMSAKSRTTPNGAGRTATRRGILEEA